MKNELFRNYDMPSKWHELRPGIRLKIRIAPFVGTVSSGRIGRTYGQIDEGRLIGRSAAIGTPQEIFEYSLMAWEGIEVEGTRDDAMAALFRNSEIRRFVMLKATGQTYK